MSATRPSKRDPLPQRARRMLLARLRRYPRAHRLAKEVAVGLKLVRYRLRRSRRNAGASRTEQWLQSQLRFDAPLHASSASALHEELRALGLEVREGRHTLYLPPQQGLARALGDLPNAFPEQTGFKILKRFAQPKDARYLYETDALAEAALAGGIHNQARTAAILAAYNLGPTLHDVVHLRTRGGDLTVLVSAHVNGRVPTEPEHAQFVQELEQLEQRELMRMVNPSRFDCGDFAVPDCNNNLFATNEGMRYVDPQVFMFDLTAVIEDLVRRSQDALHFGDVLNVVHSGDTFLYQDIPGRASAGRRDTQQRWTAFDEMLAEANYTLKGNAVFDVCCNSGMMLAHALQRGAQWGLGWDLPETAAAAAHLLPILGAGRSTIVGTSISNEAKLSQAVAPWHATKDSLCLFLAAWHHVSFPDPVGELPWSMLIYEGMEHESESVTKENVATMQSNWNCTAIGRRTLSDGICGPRPIVLLRRNPTAG